MAGYGFRARSLSGKRFSMSAPYSPAFLAYRAARDSLERCARVASARLDAIPGTGSGPMGLTPACVKAKPEWQEAHCAYSQAHNALRELNGRCVKLFKRELAQERAERRAAMIREQAA